LRDVVADYSRVASIYDTWTYFTESRSLERALELAAVVDGESILEVAVGTGIFFEKTLRRNPKGRNVGVDLTRAMLRRAQRRAEATGVPFELVEADATRLPFESASFDLVVNNNMLGLVPEEAAEAIVSEMFRVLKPGGRVVTVMMTRPAGRFGALVYQVGAVWLGGWRDVDVVPWFLGVGFALCDEIERETVAQLGIPSAILAFRRPA
jgi:ubiquinone/menaquinone biosynthesis C-methylase UbiE